MAKRNGEKKQDTRDKMGDEARNKGQRGEETRYERQMGKKQDTRDKKVQEQEIKKYERQKK